MRFMFRNRATWISCNVTHCMEGYHVVSVVFREAVDQSDHGFAA